MKDEKLEAKDLTLHLGCEVQSVPDIKARLIGVSLDNVLPDGSQKYAIATAEVMTWRKLPDGDYQALGIEHWTVENIKPILRPLSDMIEHEADELRLSIMWSEVVENECEWGPFEIDTLIALIREEFDVFGWIEKGLAIDKTKMEETV